MHPSIQTDQETKKKQQTNRETTDEKQSQEHLDKKTLGQAVERREGKRSEEETSLVEDKSHLKRSKTFLQHQSLKGCNPKKKQTVSKQKSVKSS